MMYEYVQYKSTIKIILWTCLEHEEVVTHLRHQGVEAAGVQGEL
jgi:hypothetical protein